MVLESTFEAGAQLQAHSHPHEQITYVVSGELEIRLGDGVYILCPRDSLFVPGGVRHAAAAQVHPAQPGKHLHIISHGPSEDEPGLGQVGHVQRAGLWAVIGYFNVGVGLIVQPLKAHAQQPAR